MMFFTPRTSYSLSGNNRHESKSTMLPLLLLLAAHVSDITAFQVPVMNTVSRQLRASRTTTRDSLNSGKNNNNALSMSFGKIMETLVSGKANPAEKMATSNAVAKVGEYLQFLYGEPQQRSAHLALCNVAETIDYVDTSLYNPIEGKDDLKRHLLQLEDVYLSLQNKGIPEEVPVLVVDDMACAENKVCVQYHFEIEQGIIAPDSTHISFFTLDDSSLITAVFDVREPLGAKPGSAGLRLVNAASKILEFTETGDKETTNLPVKSNLSSPNNLSENAVERYFQLWNLRDMTSAAKLFDDDCKYDDRQYPEPFSGKEAMEQHLSLLADLLPSSFTFEIDDLVVMKANSSNGGEKVGVKWHVESNGEALPFTRGLSFYTTNLDGKIQTGLDIPEPAVVKLGRAALFTSSMKNKLAAEPVRLVPLAVWVAYMYIVFFAEGILPGANALQLEQRTWEEVLDLSLNFFLVSPLLHLPFSPVVHPMLEGVFNLLLSWAALFVGFLSDDRKDKPNLLPMVPTVVGMQFLTSAFLLPYLVTRSSEKSLKAEVIYSGDLDVITRVAGESRVLGPLLGFVGTGSIFWGIFGRPEFGDWQDRIGTFGDLLSIDRVGSSFIVDLVIFALFQGWLVDDDMRRRGVNIEEGEYAVLRSIGKRIPFFGMAAYFTLRPSLPCSNGQLRREGPARKQNEIE